MITNGLFTAVELGDGRIDMATKSRSARRADQQPTEEPVAPVAVVPPRLRRRPVLVAAAVALTCVGALLGTWAFLSVSDARPVVAVRATVERGAVIERADLVVARINADPGLDPVPASQAMSLVGQRAAVDLPAGSLVTRGAVTDAVVPAGGSSVVGLGLEPGLLPAGALRSGDRVRVIGVSRQGSPPQGTERLEVAAEVSSVHPSPTSNTVVVDVIVAQEDAARVASRAAAGEVAIVLDSRER